MEKNFPGAAKRIKGFSADQFTMWLVNGFSNLKDPNAFAPLQYFIGHGQLNNVFIDLELVYDELPKQAQKNFRNGIKKNLYALSPISRDLLGNLLHLTGAIKMLDILPIINYWIDQHFLIIIDTVSGKKAEDVIAE